MTHDIKRYHVSLLLVKHPDEHGQYRYLADHQRRHFDRIVGASLNHPRSHDEVHMAVMRVISKSDDTRLWSRQHQFEFQSWTNCSHNILQTRPTKDDA